MSRHLEAENLCVFTGEAFLLAPRELPQNWAEAGCRGHVAHLLRQVPVRLCTRLWWGEFLGRSGDTGSSERPFLKPDLRRWLRAERDRIPVAERQRRSVLAAEHAIGSGLLDSVELLGAYCAFRSEADASDVYAWHTHRNGALAFPRVTSEGLRWHRVDDMASLRPSPPWQIREPVVGEHPEVSLDDIDGWIVPGLGFTQDCLRIGYGRGHYDRVLAGAPGRISIGFAFRIQVVETLPQEPHDQVLTAVATEDGVFRRPPPAP